MHQFNIRMYQDTMLVYFSLQKVSDLVLGKVSGSRIATDVGAELSFILPSNATEYFPALFDILEGLYVGSGLT